MKRRTFVQGATALAGTAPFAIPFGVKADTDMTTKNDFAFWHGNWNVRHRRLKMRLAGCTDWDEFDGTCTALQLLGGQGNMDDNVLNAPNGTYRAVTLRGFDPKSGQWAIWWLDGRSPLQLDVPMMGRFENSVGSFFADDTFEGKAVKVRFLWSRTDTPAPRWEQAFSPDGGKSWETNWIMDFTRAA